jgi:hypothetical protein
VICICDSVSSASIKPRSSAPKINAWPPLSPDLSSKVCASFNASPAGLASFGDFDSRRPMTLSFAIHLNAAIERHCDELAIRSEQATHLAFHGQSPGHAGFVVNAMALRLLLPAA